MAAFPLKAELERYAALVEKDFREVLAIVARGPGKRGTWQRRALSSLANELTPIRRPTWDRGIDEADDSEERRFADAAERVGRALLAHTSDTTPVGETTTAKLAWALVHASMDSSHARPV